MKIKHLEPGRLFQFSRSNGPEIHEVLNPVAGTYRTVALFGNAFPSALAHARGPYGGAAGDRDVKPISDHAAEELKDQGLPRSYHVHFNTELPGNKVKP